jgi:hypothetical protein
MVRRLYLVVLLGLFLGSFTLNPLLTAELPFGRVRANDVVVIFQLFITCAFFLSLKGRKVLRSKDQAVRIMSLYLGMILIMTLISKAELSDWGGNQFIANLRRVLYFGSFFYVVSMLRTSSDSSFVLRLMLFYAVVGSILTILQSLYGPTPMFSASISMDSDMYSFYNVGTWNQFDSIGGVLTRVNLPVIYIIIWAFFYFMVKALDKLELKSISLVGLFALPIFIDYSRGLFFGIFLALVLLPFLKKEKKWRLRTLFKYVFIGATILILFVVVASNLFGLDPLKIVQRRVISGAEDISQTGGTWEYRMDEVEAFQASELGWGDILFGFGLYPGRSFLGLTFIHFGPFDLLYRGGIVFSAILIVYLIWLIRYLYKKIYFSPDRLVMNLSKSLLLYNLVLAGFSFSGNQLWSENPFAVTAVVLAMIFFREHKASVTYHRLERPADPSEFHHPGEVSSKEAKASSPV